MTPFPRTFFSTKSESSSNLSEIQIEKIHDATVMFLGTTRSRSAKVLKECTATLAAQVYNATLTERTFPFCYLSLCVAGTGRIFAVPQNINGDAIDAFLGKPFKKKPPVAEQRIARIQFQMKLIEIMELTYDDIIKNWRLFLQVHGACISSMKEEELWYEILRGVTDGNQVSVIHPIEVQILCRHYLEECLPIQPENLFSYIGHSKLHEGAYAQFFGAHQATIKACATRLDNNAELRIKADEYLKKYWSAVEMDLSEAREFCKNVSNQINWVSIQGTSNCNLKHFCGSLYKGPDADVSMIETDVEELKALITETAIRVILTNRARNVLREKISEVLNSEKDAVDFQIQIPAKLS